MGKGKSRLCSVHIICGMPKWKCQRGRHVTLELNRQGGRQSKESEQEPQREGDGMDDVQMPHEASVLGRTR